MIRGEHNDLVPTCIHEESTCAGEELTQPGVKREAEIQTGFDS